MGRKQQIFVDAPALLRRIGAITIATLIESDRQLAEYAADREFINCGEAQRARWERHLLDREGVAYDLEQFAGKPLSPSERLRHQEAIRAMHSQGLIRLPGLRATRVQLTKAGWAKLGIPDPFSKPKRKRAVPAVSKGDTAGTAKP